MHLLVRERIVALSPLSYALPSLVIATLYLASGAMFCLRRRRRWAMTCLCAGMLGLCWWFVRSWQWHCRNRPASRGIRIMFWNCCRGFLGWDRVAERIPFAELDVVGLVEAGRATPEQRRFWRDRCPGMALHFFKGGIVLLAQGGIRQIEYAHPERGPRLAGARVDLKHGTLYVILADLPSAPLRDRRRAFDSVHQFVSRQPTSAPRVLMGDFNTPKWSGLFRPIRSRFNHAFESAGRGLSDTWPVPFPCLSIDHVWVEQTVDIPYCSHITTTASDHRQVVVEIDGSSLW